MSDGARRINFSKQVIHIVEFYDFLDNKKTFPTVDEERVTGLFLSYCSRKKVLASG
jgi:hypothetical protein